MFIRLMILACMAVTGTIVGAAEYTSLVPKRSAPSSIDLAPLPALSHMSGSPNESREAILEAGRERMDEILAMKKRPQRAVAPVFAGGHGGSRPRSQAARPPGRSMSAGFRNSARESIRSLLRGPSIFQQSSFWKHRAKTMPRTMSLNTPRRFGMFNHRIGGLGRVIRRSR
jgi:hypothetical protein